MSCDDGLVMALHPGRLTEREATETAADLVTVQPTAVFRL
jgi:hypothetical protein